MNDQTWCGMDSAPTDEAVPFLVRVPGNSIVDVLVLQVSHFQGQIYPDHLDANVDHEDAVTNALGWMPIPGIRRLPKPINDRTQIL